MWHSILYATLVAGIGFLIFRFQRERSALQRRSMALQTLYDVGRALTSTLDFQSLLQQVMSLSMETIGSETSSVMLVDEESGDLVLVCSRGLPGEVQPGARFPADHGIAGWVFQNGKPVMLHGSPGSDPRFNGEGSRQHIRSALSVPLVGKRGPVGVLSLNNSTHRSAFTQGDLELLCSIGAQAGIAMENARLHQLVEDAYSRLTVTVEHLRNLKSSLISMTAPSLEESLETMLDAAIEGTGALGGSLTILGERDTIHHIEALYDGKGLSLQGDEDEESTTFTFASSDGLRDATEHPSHAMIRVLTAEEKVTGLLKLMAAPEGDGFNEDDREFVDALVEHASVVVFNSLLYQEAEAGREALEKAYGALQEKQDQLVDSEKLAAVGRLAAWVCHEINNPLGAISGCAQMMQRKLRDEAVPPAASEAYEKYLTTIVSETERCARITGDLLQYTRQQEPRFMETDLHTLLGNALTLTQYKYPTGLELSSNFDPELPPMVADPQQLTQVFLNLLTNAAQAMGEGGPIRITTRYQPEGDGAVRIEVVDGGSGISDEDAAKAFDPFYTTKANGTGLGLTISKGIIEKHRGALHLVGVEGQGTTATILLPINATTAHRKLVFPAATPGERP